LAFDIMVQTLMATPAARSCTVGTIRAATGLVDPLEERDVMPEDNSHAGQGAVLLNIGGDIGALVVTMPAAMAGIEVEIRPVGAADATNEPDHAHDHDVHAHDHDNHTHDHNDHAHDHDDHDHDPHGHDHTHGHASPWPHVAVVARPAPAGIVYSLVYAELQEGSYELYVRPHGPVELTVDVAGGYVTEAVWPS
jgi:hypothetical protein